MKKLLIICLVIFLSGCDLNSKHISVEEAGGKTYVIDQKKREVFAVYGKNLILLKEEKPAPLKIGQTIQRIATISSDRLDVEAKVKFMGGKALYNLHLKPVITSELKDGKTVFDKSNLKWFDELKKDYDSYNALTIQLKDEEGFKLAEEKIRISRGYVGMVGSGSDAESYMYEGSFSVDPEIVQFTSFIDVVWNF